MGRRLELGHLMFELGSHRRLNAARSLERLQQTNQARAKTLTRTRTKTEANTKTKTKAQARRAASGAFARAAKRARRCADRVGQVCRLVLSVSISLFLLSLSLNVHRRGSRIAVYPAQFIASLHDSLGDSQSPWRPNRPKQAIWADY